MRRGAITILVSVFLLAWAASTVRAQTTKPAPEFDDQPSPFHPPSAPKSVEIGNVYLMKKAYAGALSRFKEAVKTDPYYAPGYKGLGKVYEKMGLPQKALAAYNKYLDLLPSDKDAEEAKDVHRAIKRLERQIGAHRKEAGK